MTSIILALAAVGCFGLVANGFRTGVMYGQAIDVERQKNPSTFGFLGFAYGCMGALFLTGAVFSALR